LDNVKKTSAFSRLRPTKRRIIQLYAALLYNAQLKGFVEGQIYTGPLKNLCVPGLNCYSCPGAVGACPLGALQNALASSTTRTPAYMLGIILLLGLLLGRTICGFLCPLGLIQELLYKIPTPKVKKSRYTRALSWLKYVIFAVFVIAVPLLYSLQHFPVPAFCKYICPAGTFEGAIGLLSNPNNTDKLSMLGILFTRKFVIMVLIFAAAVFVFRVFCRFICPLGAIYGLFAKYALIGVKVDSDKCTGCGVCVRSCKMDIKHVGDHECIHCGGCINSCPAKAISFGVGSKKIGCGEKGKMSGKELAAWILALCLLAGVLIFVNKPAQSEKPAEEPATVTEAADTSADEAEAHADEPAQTEESSEEPEETAQSEIDVPVGMEVGMRLPDFTAAIYGGGEFSSADCRGKILVINFWATWCTPCVNELPHFERLAAEYADELNVIALHSSLVTEDVDAWLARENYALSFAFDETGDIITSLGGSTMLPMTVVTDAKGVIVYNAVGSVSYEKLLEIIELAR